MKQIFKNYFIMFILIYILLFTLTNSKIIIDETTYALNTFIYTLFPSMFFFYTITDLLINYNVYEKLEKPFNFISDKLFHISGYSTFIVLISMISGFPSGSIYITKMYSDNKVTKDDATYLLTFAHFSNPLFILGVIGKIIGEKESIKILIIHYLSNFILAFLIRPKRKYNKKINTSNPLPLSDTLKKSFQKNFKTLLIILGNTCFFFTISKILTINIKSPLIETIINGLFDLTKGTISIKSLNASENFKMILMLTFLSLSGINICFQVKEIIKEKNLEYKYFILGRLSSCSISILLCCLTKSII